MARNQNKEEPMLSTISTIIFHATAVAIFAFGLAYLVPKFTKYHIEIIKRHGRDPLDSAFYEMFNVSSWTLLIFVVGTIMPLCVGLLKDIFSNGSNPINQNHAIAAFMCALTSVLYSFMNRYISNKLEQPLSYDHSLLFEKSSAGSTMMLCAFTCESAYFTYRHILKISILPVECVLILCLIVLSFKTYTLGRQTGVKTPWAIPAIFAALVVVGATLELIA
jgi:hypothetical protein